MAILAALSLLIIKPYLNYILFAVILSYITYPIYVKIKSNLKNKTASALIVILLIILIVLIPLLSIISQIIFQARNIFVDLGSFQLGKLKIFEEKISNYAGVNLDITDRLTGWTTNLTSNAISYLLTHMLNITKKVADLFVGFGIMLFSMFYFYVDGERIVNRVKDLIPLEERYKLHLFKEMNSFTKALFVGIFLIAIAHGIVGGLGFYIFGIPHALFWGFVMTIFALLPIGVTFIWVPGVIYLFLKGSLFGAVGLLLYGIFMLNFIDYWLRPKIVRFGVKIHPLTIVYGVIGGVVFFGFIGLILGPLIIALFLELLEVYTMVKERKPIRH
jgi:predicted PurR-regulated permease PerM